MDEADQAKALEELQQRVSIYKSRKPAVEIPAIGECLFCGEPLDENRRWCDADCRDDWCKENE